MPEQKTRTIVVDVSWTETSNYVGTIEVDVPASMTDKDRIIELLEENDLWFAEVQKIGGWPEKFLAEVEHRQVLDYNIHKPKE